MLQALAVMGIIIAVILDQGAQRMPGGQVLLRCRSSNWLNTYLNKLFSWVSQLGITQSYLIIIALLIPLCLGLLLLKIIFSLLLGKVIGPLLFLSIALWYLLGNKEVEQHSSSFVQAHERSFGILFWFAVLGPIGALIYWFFVVCKQNGFADDKNPEFSVALNWLHAIAAWLPARITGFIYALVGNFTAGFNCWRKCIGSPMMQSSDMLAECGDASVDANIADDANNLVTRAFIAWVVLAILIVVVR